MEQDNLTDANVILAGRGLATGRLASKKNRVFLVLLGPKMAEMAVLKVFPPCGKALSMESETLALAAQRGIRVPKILEIGDGHILLEHIEGERVFDIIHSERDIEEKMVAIRDVAYWLADFHEEFHEERLLRGDCNLKNFIVREEGGQKTIVGLDFEEAHKGDGREDLAQTCTSVMMASFPISEEQYYIAKHLVSSYSMRKGESIDLEDISQHISSVLEHLALWRNDGQRIKDLAAKIEKEGIRNQISRE